VINRMVVLATILLLWSANCFSAPSVNKTITAVGEGITRKQAIQSALRAAIEQGVGTYLSSESVVQNFMLINDTILSRAQGYIKQYSIEKEKRTTDGLVRVTVKALVTLNSIKNDLMAIGVLLAQVGKPKILVIPKEPRPYPTKLDIVSKYTGKYGVSSKTEEQDQGILFDYAIACCSEFFQKRGFHLLNPTTITNVKQKVQDLSDPQNDSNSKKVIGKIAKEHDPHIYIIVDMTITDKGFYQQAYWAGSQLELKAFEAGSGEMLGASSSISEAGHADGQAAAKKAAIKSAVHKASSNMLRQMLKKFEQMVNAGRPYEIQLHNCEDYKVAQQFKSALKHLPFYADGMQMSSNDGLYHFNISLKCNAPDEVADALLNVLTKENSFKGLTVKKIQGTMISFALP